MANRERTPPDDEDFNEAAFRVVREATRERPEKALEPPRKDEKKKDQ
jgi:hypothetical protein